MKTRCLLGFHSMIDMPEVWLPSIDSLIVTKVTFVRACRFCGKRATMTMRFDEETGEPIR